MKAISKSKTPQVTTKKSQAFTKKPHAIERIAESVSNLLVPSLAPLHQTYRDQKAGIRAKRAELLRKQQAILDEGYGAASRLMTLDAETVPVLDASYFKRISQQQGDKDGQ